MKTDTSRVQRVQVTEVWPKENTDFTPWLCKNIDILSECLGFKIQNPEREQSTGNFSVDIKAEDENGRVVAIENQYGNSDHDHLGKLITYRTAFDAKIAVWIVENARQEHVETINWLNEIESGCDFYLVEFSAIKIDNSLPAPLFNILARPNEQTKVIGKIKKSDIEREDARLQFWTEHLQLCSDNQLTEFANSTPSRGSWVAVGAGISGVGYFFWANKDDIRVSLEIDKGPGKEDENQKLYDCFYKEKDTIEKKVGQALTWQNDEGIRKNSFYCQVTAGGWKSGAEKKKKAMLEAIEVMKKFIGSTKDIIKEIRK